MEVRVRDVRPQSYGSRYVVTEQGAYELRTAATCSCTPHLSGLLLECSQCKTVYGVWRESYIPSMHPQRKKD